MTARKSDLRFKKEKSFPYVVRSAEILYKVQEARKIVGLGHVEGEEAENLLNCADSLYFWLLFRLRESHVAIPCELESHYDCIERYF